MLQIYMLQASSGLLKFATPGLTTSISPGAPALTPKSALPPFLLRARADGSKRSRLLGSASAVHRGGHWSCFN